MANIITNEEFQTYSQIKGDFDSDTLNLIIGTANDIVTDYLGYDPLLQDYDDYFSGNGTSFLHLLSAPIIAITSIKIDGVEQTLTDFITSKNLLIEKNRNKVFNIGIYNIQIEYEGGYLLQSETGTTPKLPNIITYTALRIADSIRIDLQAHFQTTVNTQDGGTRTYTAWQNYEKQLSPISKYRLLKWT